MPLDGYVKKSMLASLAEFNNLTLLQLARSAYMAADPTANQMRGARKALNRLLEDQKIVESPWRNDKGDRCFSLPGGARKQIKRSLTAVK